MTPNQLETLTDDELEVALYIVNVIAPPAIPVMTFEPQHLTWFKHDSLIKKFLEVFPRLKPERHTTYVSLMQKLGVKVEIKQNPNEPSRAKNTGNNPSTPIPSIPTDVPPVTGSNATRQ
jgi:hypothetical protein